MVQKALGLVVSLMMTFLGCLMLLDLTVLLNQKLDISQTTRKYLLKMEADGYLTTENSTQLVSELGHLGVTGVSLSGSTLTDAGYGNNVILQFTGTLHYKEIRLLSLLQAKEKVSTEPVRERLVSTAKN